MRALWWWIFIIALAALTHPSLAQTGLNCAPLSDLAKMLAEQWSEERVGVGLTRESTLLQVFVSPAGTWTLVISAPNGNACPLATGYNWENYPPPKTGTKG